jgi:outer membrane protein OmpA-like peptidoglycan-associated protein
MADLDERRLRSPLDPASLSHARSYPRHGVVVARRLAGVLAFTGALALGATTSQAAPPTSNDEAGRDEAAASEGGASASGSVSLDGKREGKASKRGKKRKTSSSSSAAAQDDRWIVRHAPERNTGELGAFGGVWLPSPQMELFQADDALPDQGFRPWAAVGPMLGLRGGYYPIRHFGIEGELGWSPTQTRREAASVDMITPRAHVVGQLGLWSITPFILAGVGMQGVVSRRSALGSEADVALHFGAGLKFHINDALGLRLDGRIDLTNQRGVGEGVTPSPEILLGLFGTFGRKKDPGRDCASCVGDRDGDGVPDNCDRCPDEPGPEPLGCPLADRDQDQIDDGQDECPTEPETRNGYDDDDGCPDEVPAELVDLVGVLKGVVFDTDKDTIKAESRPILDKAADILARFETVKVEIVGHTDNRGSYAHNMDLSRRRAQSVKAYLAAKGVAASRMKTRGMGPSEPIADNETDPGRQENRRIEFRVVSGGGVSSER